MINLSFNLIKINKVKNWSKLMILKIKTQSVLLINSQYMMIKQLKAIKE